MNSKELQPLQSQGREVPTGHIGWQLIETAPKDGSTVLLADGGYVDCGFWNDASECYRGEAGWFSEDDRSNLLIARNIHPTHWMPLPAPPTSGASSPKGAAPATGQSLNFEAREATSNSSGPDEPTPDSAEPVSVELRQRMGRE